MPSEMMAALIGALVGGSIGIIGQFIAIHAAAKQLRKEKKERQEALAYSLSIKLIKICSNISSMKKHADESFSDSLVTQADARPWQVFRILPNPFGHLYFEADELGMLMSIGGREVLNKVVLLDSSHNGIVDLFKLHKDIRDRLDLKLEADVQGKVGTISLSQEEMRRLNPEMTKLDSLIETINEQCTSGLKFATSGLYSYIDLVNDKMNLDIKLISKTEVSTSNVED